MQTFQANSNIVKYKVNFRIINMIVLELSNNYSGISNANFAINSL
jgi:hypothetical protein